ncbi:MAG: lytic murein transglycosylase [Alphaproteobacteria bacterium]|nr:lytic murein transglycosylase [Alphaproteobacteria bacterium]
MRIVSMRFFTHAVSFCNFLVLALFFCLFYFSSDWAMADENFKKWVNKFWLSAENSGISRQVYTTAFNGVIPDESVIKSALNQPEFKMHISAYLNRVVSDSRIKDGLSKAKEHREILDTVETLYGVDRYIVLAIWGIETNYGQFMGDKYIVRSLSTLAYRGVRKDFSHKQLISVLKILERGDIKKKGLLGSWAGAMGHMQFIPTTYETFAVDMSADGKRDIWSNLLDALGSTANYLYESGWNIGEPWGYPVLLPPNFDYSLADEKMRSSDEWKRLGFRTLGGGDLPLGMGHSILIFPAGASGTAFLVGQNFRAVLRYNNSHHYALAVGILSDRLRGYAPFKLRWDPNDRTLSKRECKEFQAHLSRLGYSVGSIDGVVGSLTRSAIRRYQLKTDLPVDSYPSWHLLKRLRREKK